MSVTTASSAPQRRDQRSERNAIVRAGRRRDKGQQVDRAEREQYYAKPFGDRRRIAATRSRIPTRLSPSLPPSSSNLSKKTKEQP